MQNNEFEKQVQKKMDELKLAPSSEVWQKVEASLPKEKNRRWLIFAFLFAALSTATLLLVNNEPAHNKNTVQLPLQKNHIAALEQKNDNNTMPAQNEIKKSPEQEKQAFSNNTVNSDAADNTLKTGSPSPITTHSAGEDIPVKMEIKDQPDPLNHTADPVSSNINNEKKFRENYLKQPSVLESLARMKLTITSPALNEEENRIPNGENERKEKNKTDITITPATTSKQDKTEEKAKQKVELTVKEKPDSTKNNVTVKTPDKKKMHPWQYSIQFGAGLPYTKNGINNTVFTVNTNSLTSAPVGVYVPANQPATPSPGKVFQTGITIEKNIVGRLDFKTGLMYTYLSNHMKIGNKIDSLSRNGTSTYNNSNGIGSLNSANENTYNNYFRFIQLPLALQFNVVKKDQFSVFLEGGASLEYMIKSNALLFDGVTNTYSTSKSIYNRMVYTGLGGIGVKMAQQTKIPVTIGYQLSYGLKPFFKNADAQERFTASLLYFRLYLNK